MSRRGSRSIYSNGEWGYNDEGTTLGYTDDSIFADHLAMLLRLQEAGAVPTTKRKSPVGLAPASRRCRSSPKSRRWITSTATRSWRCRPRQARSATLFFIRCHTWKVGNLATI